VYGSNPIMAPTFVPQCLEHVKQHLTLWYLNQVDGYASVALDRPFNVLKEQKLPHEADKLLGAVVQHVHQDIQETLSGVTPIIQQAMDMLKKLQGQPQPDPATQAFIQTSMAETQRRAQKDQGDLQLGVAKLQQQDSQQAIKVQADMIQNTENNLTQERIKSAELTRDAASLQHEQLQTAINAQNQLQQTLGGQQ